MSETTEPVIDERVNEVIVRVEEITSEGTGERYGGAIRVFDKWCTDRPHDAFDVTYLDVEDYLRTLKEERDYAYSTANVHFSALAKFYEAATELVDAERIDVDVADEPTEDVSLNNVYTDKSDRKGKKKRALGGSVDRHALPPEDMENIVNNVPSPTVRNQLLVRLTYQGMLRRKEVARLKLGDIDREKQSITIRSEVAKNGEERTVYYMPDLDHLISLWWDVDRKSYALASDSDYLFLSNEREHLSGFHVGDIINRAAENAGLQETLYTDARGNEKKKITTHTLRHSGAVRRWRGEKGADLRTLQLLLGHESIKTTEEYLDVADKDLAKKSRSTW